MWQYFWITYPQTKFPDLSNSRISALWNQHFNSYNKNKCDSFFELHYAPLSNKTTNEILLPFQIFSWGRRNKLKSLQEILPTYVGFRYDNNYAACCLKSFRFITAIIDYVLILKCFFNIDINANQMRNNLRLQPISKKHGYESSHFYALCLFVCIMLVCLHYLKYLSSRCAWQNLEN